jgi:hypothetical protein
VWAPDWFGRHGEVKILCPTGTRTPARSQSLSRPSISEDGGIKSFIETEAMYIEIRTREKWNFKFDHNSKFYMLRFTVIVLTHLWILRLQLSAPNLISCRSSSCFAFVSQVRDFSLFTYLHRGQVLQPRNRTDHEDRSRFYCRIHYSTIRYSSYHVT